MGSEFEIKDLGALKYFLGIEAARSKELPSQNESIQLDLLVEKGKLWANPLDTLGGQSNDLCFKAKNYFMIKDNSDEISHML